MFAVVSKSMTAFKVVTYIESFIFNRAFIWISLRIGCKLTQLIIYNPIIERFEHSAVNCSNFADCFVNDLNAVTSSSCCCSSPSILVTVFEVDKQDNMSRQQELCCVMKSQFRIELFTKACIRYIKIYRYECTHFDTVERESKLKYTVITNFDLLTVTTNGFCQFPFARIHFQPKQIQKSYRYVTFFPFKQIFEEVSWKKECIRRKMKSFVILFEFMSVAKRLCISPRQREFHWEINDFLCGVEMVTAVRHHCCVRFVPFM